MFKILIKQTIQSSTVHSFGSIVGMVLRLRWEDNAKRNEKVMEPDI